MARRANDALVEKLVQLVARELRLGKTPLMNEVCAELGVSPSIVNHHFSDRQELLSQAWRSIVLASIDDDYQRLDAFGDGEDWEAVGAFIYEIFSPERQAARLAYLRAISEALGDEKLREIVEEAQERTRQGWHELLEKYVASGVLKPKVSVSFLAFFFAALPLGVTAVKFELTEAERKDISESWMNIMEMALRG